MTLAISDYLNLVRDKDVSKLGPESAKTGLFYVLFTLGSANIKPECYQHPTHFPIPILCWGLTLNI